MGSSSSTARSTTSSSRRGGRGTGPRQFGSSFEYTHEGETGRTRQRLLRHDTSSEPSKGQGGEGKGKGKGRGRRSKDRSPHARRGRGNSGVVESMDLDASHEELFKPFRLEKPDNLSQVLRSPHMRNQFREFLRRSLAEENLLFFQTIELYQKITKPKWREVAGRQMVEKFLDPKSLYQVNLSYETTQPILNCAEYAEATFDPAKREIFKLMSANFFDRFLLALDATEKALNEERERKREAVKKKRASSSRFSLSRLRRSSTVSVGKIAVQLRAVNKSRSSANLLADADADDQVN